MIQIGSVNKLKVLRQVDFGFYLEDGASGILLPTRFAPLDLKIDDDIEVFLYHDSEDRLIATTQNPKGKVGDFLMLECVDITPQGAFLNNGLMKDLFVPKSKQLVGMKKTGKYIVNIYLDEQTGRMAATEKIDFLLTNENLTINENDEVSILILRETNIGFFVIINNKYSGVLHFNDVFEKIKIGDTHNGYIKKIYQNTNTEKILIDVAIGKQGYQKVENESEKIIRLLKEHNSFLAFNDKSDPEQIYSFFGMSKKVFKMTIGYLYKQRIINLENNGIVLLNNK